MSFRAAAYILGLALTLTVGVLVSVFFTNLSFIAGLFTGVAIVLEVILWVTPPIQECHPEASDS